jgi:hypothetical protein
MSKSADHAAEALQAILAAISVEDLIGELATRDGVGIDHIIKDNESYLIQKTNTSGQKEILEQYTGPVRIITVVDP